jgi:LmbE family N-acetylglucosaminyl deacetylase
MKWIYLSPHLDDAVYSCGSMIYQQVQDGQPVEIWTIFAGDPTQKPFSSFANDIHARWGTGDNSIAARRQEDQNACAFLGAQPRYFDFLDVIYRTDPVTGQAEIVENADLFRNYHSADLILQHAISQQLVALLNKLNDYKICIPLALGHHIDHTLVRKAAEALILPVPLRYYADFPYVLEADVETEGRIEESYAIHPQSLKAWGEAIALYPSQISTFWQTENQMREALTFYWQKGGGSRLWF